MKGKVIVELWHQRRIVWHLGNRDGAVAVSGSSAIVKS